MKKDKLIKFIKGLIPYLEILLGSILTIGVIAAIPDTFKYLYKMIFSNQAESYAIFGDFLKHILMLVVGIELMIMIITHSYESILTLVLFVIARKMLVFADGMKDIFIGTLAIAVIFVVIKFLQKDEKMLARYDNTFSAAMPIEKIRREFGYKLPTEMSHTIGGLIYELSKIYGFKLEEGVSFVHGNYTFTLFSVTEGVIERVRIHKNE